MKKEVKIILLISIIIIIMTVVIIFGRVFLFKKNNTNNSADPNDYLISTFVLYNKCSTGKEFTFNNGIVNANDLTIDDINYITYNYLQNQGIKTTLNKKTNLQHLKIKQSDFLETVKKLFGQNYQYNLPETLIINDSVYTLTGKYYEGDINFLVCFDELYPQFYHYNTYDQDNTYNIEYALYWLITTYDSDNQIIKESIFSSKNSTEETCLKNEIKNNLDKFTKYRFVFKDNGTNYIFDHIELVK